MIVIFAVKLTTAAEYLQEEVVSDHIIQFKLVG